MISPTPRPALRKAPDSNIHPAEPPQTPDRAPALELRTPGAAATAKPPPRQRTAQTAAQSRVLRMPGIEASPTNRGKRLTGTTSDTMRPVKHGRQDARARREPVKEKMVDLAVKVPKSLRKELRAAAKSAGRTPEEVVASLVRAWIDN